MPVTVQVIGPSLDKNKWHSVDNMQGMWPTMESGFLTATAYK